MSVTLLAFNSLNGAKRSDNSLLLPLTPTLSSTKETMRHLYYTLQTLLRGHGGTAEKIISLTLGLLMGVLLFAQIAYELSFDRFYPNPDTLVMLRMRNVDKGVLLDTHLLQGRQEAGGHPDPLCRHRLLRHHRPDSAAR